VRVHGYRIITFLLALAAVLGAPRMTSAADYVVYSVYRELDLGNPGEAPQKDFYVNMGTAQGVHSGMTLKVFRRVSTYDLLSEKLYRDVSFPIARIKVIHAENNAAIARLEKMLPEAATPAYSPRAVMVGDLVEITE
jgi:hypothetical protein